MTKQELRQQIRAAKRQFTGEELAEMSLRIINALEQHPRFVDAKTVLLYHSLPDEPCTHDLINRLEGKTVLLPRVISDTEMELRLYSGEGDLQIGAFGILEPCGKPFDDYSSIDLAIIPGMAFDKDCHRLGRGKGYYDRFLSRAHDIYKVGICFPFQLVDNVPTEETDIAMDEVIC